VIHDSIDRQHLTESVS